MSLKDITITGSIGSVPTQSYGQKWYVSSTDDQSFPLEHISGSAGGATPDFNGKDYTTDLFVNITQSWSGSMNTPVGIVDFVHNTEEEFINGEYSGSSVVVEDGSLIDEQCKQFLTVSTKDVDYKVYFYYSSGSKAIPLGIFLDSNTTPNDGEIYLYWNYVAPYNPGGIIPPPSPE